MVGIFKDVIIKNEIDEKVDTLEKQFRSKYIKFMTQ